MIDKPHLSEKMRNELPSSFLDIYDNHLVGGLGIPGDFFIEYMTTLKKHGIYEQLLLHEYIEGEESILSTKTEILHAAFLACDRRKLRELCSDPPTDQTEYTVYRGATEEWKQGISWALCQLHATHFACNKEQGRLYKITVSTQDVLAFALDNFCEYELIIIPKPKDIVELQILPKVRKMMNEYYEEEFNFPLDEMKPDSCRNCPNKICLKFFGDHP